MRALGRGRAAWPAAGLLPGSSSVIPRAWRFFYHLITNASESRSAGNRTRSLSFVILILRETTGWVASGGLWRYVPGRLAITGACGVALAVCVALPGRRPADSGIPLGHDHDRQCHVDDGAAVPGHLQRDAATVGGALL